jgi:hypothetical protein
VACGRPPSSGSVLAGVVVLRTEQGLARAPPDHDLSLQLPRPKWGGAYELKHTMYDHRQIRSWCIGVALRGSDGIAQHASESVGIAARLLPGAATGVEGRAGGRPRPGVSAQSLHAVWVDWPVQ